MVALEAADVEGLHDATAGCMAARGGVDHFLVLTTVCDTHVRVVLHDEVVGNGLSCTERGWPGGLRVAAEGEPGDGYGSDEVLHVESRVGAISLVCE